MPGGVQVQQGICDVSGARPHVGVDAIPPRGGSENVGCPTSAGRPIATLVEGHGGVGGNPGMAVQD